MSSDNAEKLGTLSGRAEPPYLKGGQLTLRPENYTLHRVAR